jgi:hypothetical protein
MKKEAPAFIRHPHYPEIIKFKIGSLKTTSTLSTSNYGDADDINNCEKLSMPGDPYNMNDNFSNMGDNDKPGCLSFSSNKKNNFLNNTSGFHRDHFDKMYFDMEDHPQHFDDDYQMEIHSGSTTL